MTAVTTDIPADKRDAQIQVLTEAVKFATAQLGNQAEAFRLICDINEERHALRAALTALVAAGEDLGGTAFYDAEAAAREVLARFPDPFKKEATKP